MNRLIYSLYDLLKGLSQSTDTIVGLGTDENKNGIQLVTQFYTIKIHHCSFTDKYFIMMSSNNADMTAEFDSWYFCNNKLYIRKDDDVVVRIHF